MLWSDKTYTNRLLKNSKRFAFHVYAGNPDRQYTICGIVKKRVYPCLSISKEMAQAIVHPQHTEAIGEEYVRGQWEKNADGGHFEKTQGMFFQHPANEMTATLPHSIVRIETP